VPSPFLIPHERNSLVLSANRFADDKQAQAAPRCGGLASPKKHAVAADLGEPLPLSLFGVVDIAFVSIGPNHFDDLSFRSTSTDTFDGQTAIASCFQR